MSIYSIINLIALPVYLVLHQVFSCGTGIPCILVVPIWLCLWARGAGLSTGAGLACKLPIDYRVF